VKLALLVVVVTDLRRLNAGRQKRRRRLSRVQRGAPEIPDFEIDIRDYLWGKDEHQLGKSCQTGFTLLHLVQLG